MNRMSMGAVLAAIGLSACATQSPLVVTEEDLRLLTAQTKPFEVTWQVKEVDGELILETKKEKTPKCSGKFSQQILEKGCFFAEQNETMVITFKLKPNYKGSKWRFTEIKLCEGVSKGAASNCSLGDISRYDFLVDANNELLPFPPEGDPEEGRVDLTQASTQLREFKVRNFNFEKASYVYVLKACKEGQTTGEGNCVESDPGGMNRGRGGR